MLPVFIRLPHGNMSLEIRKVMHASLLGLGLFLIPSLLLLPADWIYDRLAIRAAFGQDAGSLPEVTVQSIKKPSTVTFSNGIVVNVGYWPARISSGFWVVTTLAGVGVYIHGLRHQIRNFTSQLANDNRQSKPREWRIGRL